MYKGDKMTPNERMAAYMEGREFDRIPAMPFLDSVACKFAGMSHREKRLSAENTALCQTVSYEKLGHDGLSIEYGLHGIGAACGSMLSNPENAVPAIKEFYLQDLKNIEDKLSLEKVMRKNDPWFQLNYEACEICIDRHGSEVATSVSLPGPLTAAASLYPVEKLLKALARDSENVHKLLRFSTEAIKIVMEDFIKLGVGIFVCDPVASGNLIHRNRYLEFVFPYTKELMNFSINLKGETGYHICGNTNKITEDMLDTGCVILSVDTRVKLTDAKRIAGPRVPIIGNVDPIDVMLLGKKDDIYKSVKQNIEDCWGAENGYIVSTGCDIPYDAPLENIYHFMDAVRKYGSWKELQKLSVKQEVLI